MMSKKKVSELGTDEFVKVYGAALDEFKDLLGKAKLICTEELYNKLVATGEILHDLTDRLEEDETVQDAMLEKYNWDEDRYASKAEAADKLGDYLTLDLFTSQVRLLAHSAVANSQGEEFGADPSDLYH